MTASVAVLFLSVPFLSNEVTNTRFPLILKVWTPFEVTDDNYWYIYGLQMIHIIFGCTHTCCFDTLFLGFMMRIVNQMELMIHRLKELGLRIKNGTSQDTDQVLVEIIRQQYFMFGYDN